MTASSSLIARSKSLPSTAVFTRPINRLAVSLGEPSQIAQMRFSTYFALSSSGATLSASNNRSRFWVLSPRCARGSVLGGSIGLSGSGKTVSARAGTTQSRARSAVAANGRNRRLMPRSLTRYHGTIKTRFVGAAVQDRSGASRTSALPGLEAALDLVDHVDPPLAADQTIIAVAAAQRFQRVADFHGSGSGLRGRAGCMRWQSCAETRDATGTRQHARPASRRPPRFRPDVAKS